MTPRRLVPLERDVQESIKDALSWCGFVVLHTSAHRQKASSGVSYGVPDLLVGVVGLPVWFGVEVKRPGKVRLTPAQSELSVNGQIIVVVSPLQALRGVVFAAAAVWPDGPPRQLVGVLDKARRAIEGLGGQWPAAWPND